MSEANSAIEGSVTDTVALRLLYWDRQCKPMPV